MGYDPDDKATARGDAEERRQELRHLFFVASLVSALILAKIINALTIYQLICYLAMGVWLR
ncbi:MAG TPA: hypothetical protein VN868_10925 [Terriglobales bacterium]|jgi:hypothetical protein|nr:hypothetical protein [Terriglobales bacterium]